MTKEKIAQILLAAPDHVGAETYRAIADIERRLAAGEIDRGYADWLLDRVAATTREIADSWARWGAPDA